MGNGVMVVDMRDQLIDINRAAAKVLEIEGPRAPGQPIRSALASHPDLVELFRGAIKGRSEIGGVADAARVAKRLLRSLGEAIRVDGQEVFATTSIGIAVYPDDGEDAETLIRNADRAMHHAKSRGRNNFQFYTESLNDSGSRRLYLEAHLRRAFEQNELTVHYQPVHDTVTGQLTSAEALLRWDSPEAGAISPAEFVPVAEESGLIASIGEWVLRSACLQSRAWRDAGYRGIRMAVNLSEHQIRQSNLAEMVAGALEETGLEASDLELEITESTIMQDDQVTLDTLRELHPVSGSSGTGPQRPNQPARSRWKSHCSSSEQPGRPAGGYCFRGVGPFATFTVHSVN
jgi:hypothetical protein